MIPRDDENSRDGSTERKKETLSPLSSLPLKADPTPPVKETVESKSEKPPVPASGNTKQERVKINTRAGFMSEKTCPIPRGWIRATKADTANHAELKQQLRRAAFDKSAFKRRLVYDDEFKRQKGVVTDIPSQQDFLKMKIKEKDCLLKRLVAEGKQELQA